MFITSLKHDVTASLQPNSICIHHSIYIFCYTHKSTSMASVFFFQIVILYTYFITHTKAQAWHKFFFPKPSFYIHIFLHTQKHKHGISLFFQIVILYTYFITHTKAQAWHKFFFSNRHSIYMFCYTHKSTRISFLFLNRPWLGHSLILFFNSLICFFKLLSHLSHYLTVCNCFNCITNISQFFFFVSVFGFINK